MKINSSIPSPTTSATPPKARHQAAATTAPTSSVASDDSVSMHLQQAGPLGATVSPFDSQRVAEIRQAIVEGHFQIDAEKIASRLIDGVRDLLAKDRPTA